MLIRFLNLLSEPLSVPLGLSGMTLSGFWKVKNNLTDTSQVLVSSHVDDLSILETWKACQSAGVLEPSCQNIGMGFFFFDMVNHFDRVLSYMQNILKCIFFCKFD